MSFYSNLSANQRNGFPLFDNNPYPFLSSNPSLTANQEGRPANQSPEPDNQIALIPPYLERLLLDLCACNEKIEKHKGQLALLESDLREEKDSFTQPPSFHFQYLTKTDVRIFIQKYMPARTRTYLQISMKEEEFVTDLAEKDLHHQMYTLIRKVIDIHKQVQQQLEQSYWILNNQIVKDLGRFFPMQDAGDDQEVKNQTPLSLPSQQPVIFPQNNRGGAFNPFIREESLLPFQQPNPSEVKLQLDTSYFFS